MKPRSLLITLALLLFGAVSTVSAEEIVVIGGVKYTIHDVARGETLYSLSKRYGVKVDDIVSANRVLVDGLKAGQRIKIPVPTSAEPTPKSLQHKVIKGETLYSLSRRHGLTVEELREANPHIKKGLKAGQIITIPQKVVAEQPKPKPTAPATPITPAKPQPSVAAEQSAPQPQPAQVAEEKSATEEQNSAESNPATVEQVAFRALKHGERAEVALLLPLGSEQQPSQNYLDLYRGFLIGLDSVRMEGYSVNLNLYNTAHDYNRVAEIVASGALDKANLVVGPVYEDELIPVVTALQGKNTPIVSPLANLTQTTSGAVFQMSPSPKSKYEKIRPLFDGSKRVVVISTDNTDKEFESEVLALLGDTPYIEHKYIYEHPSVIEKREKEREAARAEGLIVDDTPSPSDMSPLLKGEEESIFVITANNEVEVDRILAAIASANIALTARSQRVVPFVIFGNNRWNRYRNIDRSILFANNVTMLSTYHAHRSEARIQNFDRRFVEEFGSLPSLYAYRGYDAAVIFIKALYGDIESGLEGAHYLPLLSPYTFEVESESGLHINSNWVKVNYNSNYTITIE